MGDWEKEGARGPTDTWGARGRGRQEKKAGRERKREEGEEETRECLLTWASACHR